MSYPRGVPSQSLLEEAKGVLPPGRSGERRLSREGRGPVLRAHATIAKAPWACVAAHHAADVPPPPTQACLSRWVAVRGCRRPRASALWGAASPRRARAPSRSQRRRIRAQRRAPARCSDLCTSSSVRGAEAGLCERAARSEPDEDLARPSLKPLLQFHGIVARIEDEQGVSLFPSKPAH